MEGVWTPKLPSGYATADVRITSHNLYSTCAENIRLQHERKRVDADATLTGLSITVWLSGLLADDASFQFVDVLDLGTIS